MERQYFFIKDIKSIGKIEDYVPYIYEEKSGWKIDNSNILMDRIIGYDGERIGSTDEMFSIEEISESEAIKIISQQ